jgi:hypothetical protein
MPVQIPDHRGRDKGWLATITGVQGAISQGRRRALSLQCKNFAIGQLMTSIYGDAKIVCMQMIFP